MEVWESSKLVVYIYDSCVSPCLPARETAANLRGSPCVRQAWPLPSEAVASGPAEDTGSSTRGAHHDSNVTTGLRPSVSEVRAWAVEIHILRIRFNSIRIKANDKGLPENPADASKQLWVREKNAARYNRSRKPIIKRSLHEKYTGFTTAPCGFTTQ